MTPTRAMLLNWIICSHDLCVANQSFMVPAVLAVLLWNKKNLPKTPTVCLVLTCWNVLLLRYDGSTKEASFSIGLQGMAEEDTERVKQIISQTIDDIIEYVTHSHRIYGVRICTAGLREWNRSAKPVVSFLSQTGPASRRNGSRRSSTRSRSRWNTSLPTSACLWPRWVHPQPFQSCVYKPPSGRYLVITEDVSVCPPLMRLHFVFFVFFVQ